MMNSSLQWTQKLKVFRLMLSFMPAPPMLYPSIYGSYQSSAMQTGVVSTFAPISDQQAHQTHLPIAPVTERIIRGNKNRQQIQRKKKLLKIKDPNTGKLIQTRNDLKI